MKPRVEARALAHLELEVQRLAVLDREPAVVADGVDRVRDQRADLRVAGGDRGDARDLLAVRDGDGLHVAQVRDDLRDGELDAAPQRERVRARRRRCAARGGRAPGRARSRSSCRRPRPRWSTLATWRTSRAPARSNTAPRSIPAAIVAPSLVIVSRPSSSVTSTLRPARAERDLDRVGDPVDPGLQRRARLGAVAQPPRRPVHDRVRVVVDLARERGQVAVAGLGDHALGREHVLGDRGGVGQRGARDHHRVDHARRRTGRRTRPWRRRGLRAGRARATVGDRASTARCPALRAIWRSGSSSARRTISAPVATSALAAGGVDRAARVQQRRAAARDDALGQRRARGADRVLDAVAALEQLGLGVGADADRRDAPAEPRHPLAQLVELELVEAVAGRELGADLLDPRRDRVRPRPRRR